MEIPIPGNRSDEDAWLLATLTALEPERFLRRMPGRETLLTRISSFENGARLVVKRFHGGPSREGWREWLHRRPVRSEARREFENLRDLAAVGVPVPKAVRCVENEAAARLLGGGGRGRSAVVMECVEHLEDLRELLGRVETAERRLWLERLVALVRRFHERGWIHRDLYLQHFLVPLDDERPLVLIDVARARFSPRTGRRWLVKDMAALHLSAPGPVTRSDRLRFLKTWLQGQGQRELLRWKNWALDIDRKAQRLGAHRPKYEDPEQRVGVEPERELRVPRAPEPPTPQRESVRG